MQFKLIKFFIICLLLITTQSNNLYSSDSKSLEFSDNKISYQHLLKSVSDDGDLVTFENNMSFTINFWYRSVAKKWKKGEQVYLFYGLTYDQIQLQHTDSQTIAWGVIHSDFSKIWLIKAITNRQSNLEPYSMITLNNGHIFKTIHYQILDKRRWKVKDRILILANSDSLYQIWNMDTKEIVLCEFLANSNQMVSKLNEIKDILSLEDRLNAKVLQQPEATKALLESLLNYTAGLKEPGKPIGIFLFIGPTGVGKTELAKNLALEMYDDPARILRFDMSHFADQYSISRLIGSPPGYVNHEEGGQLTNPLWDNSRMIVLLDEIEKAHPQVIKTFLPVFDEGYILDNKNNFISCSETIFIMTSNLCYNKIIELYRQGYCSEDILAEIEPELMKALSPELYNRVEPILFRPLAKETMDALVDVMLDKIVKRLRMEKQIEIHIDQSLKNFLVENGYHPLLGARPLKKLIEKSILSTLAHKIIKEGIEGKCEFLLLYDKETNSIIIQT